VVDRIVRRAFIGRRRYRSSRTPRCGTMRAVRPRKTDPVLAWVRVLSVRVVVGGQRVSEVSAAARGSMCRLPQSDYFFGLTTVSRPPAAMAPLNVAPSLMMTFGDSSVPETVAVSVNSTRSAAISPFIVP
jgi:hypothetical protein